MTTQEMWSRRNLAVACRLSGWRVQTTVALSSGENEYYALLRASSHLLGSMLSDWGYSPRRVILCDPSAACGISAGQRFSKMRHVGVRQTSK
eukprot:6408693-Amphidinium_carterae.1